MQHKCTINTARGAAYLLQAGRKKKLLCSVLICFISFAIFRCCHYDIFARSGVSEAARKGTGKASRGEISRAAPENTGESSRPGAGREPHAVMDKSLQQYEESLEYFADTIKYSEYLKKFGSEALHGTEHVIDAGSFAGVEGMTVEMLEDYKGMEGMSVLTSDQGLIKYEIHIKQTGLYNISFL